MPYLHLSVHTCVCILLPVHTCVYVRRALCSPVCWLIIPYLHLSVHTCVYIIACAHLCVGMTCPVHTCVLIHYALFTPECAHLCVYIIACAHLCVGATCTLRGRATAGNTSTHATWWPAAVAAVDVRNRDEIFRGEASVDREAALQCKRHGTVMTQCFLTTAEIRTIMVCGRSPKIELCYVFISTATVRNSLNSPRVALFR